ncbi:titin-like isoform X2 [Neocloeon triangulifer]|uniref:titin-like isoform X2 n=1 Tax=Neocloeon triangulifer TaxID=2078957 RepID=UPI00286F1DAA|nr:titin-like isoform X2 [Neocloeon triangulifer]
MNEEAALLLGLAAPRTQPGQPATTTISTIALRNGNNNVVIALLQSADWVQLKVLDTSPPLTQLGANLDQASDFLNVHELLLKDLQATHNSPEQYLRQQVDAKLASTNGNPDLYSAMANSLALAWRDLSQLFEDRKNLLVLNVNYHRSAEKCIERMRIMREIFGQTIVPSDADVVSKLISDMNERRRSMLEAFMEALLSGKVLLEKLREIEQEGSDNWSPGNTKAEARAAISQVEHWMEALHDKRRDLDKLWFKWKDILFKASTISSLAAELAEVEETLRTRRDGLAGFQQLGEHAASAELLLREHHKLVAESRELQGRVIRITKTNDGLNNNRDFEGQLEVYWANLSAHAFVVLNLSSEYLHLLEFRIEIIAFLIEAHTAQIRMDQVESDLASLDIPLGSSNLAQVHLHFFKTLEEITKEPIEKGQLLLAAEETERNGASEVVRRVIEELQRRKRLIESQCESHQETTLHMAQALTHFYDKYNELRTWLEDEAKMFVQSHQDIGCKLVQTQSFLDQHRGLQNNMKLKAVDLATLNSMLSEFMDHLSPDQRDDIWQKMTQLREEWQRLESNLDWRVDLGEKISRFYSLSVKLSKQIESAEEALKSASLERREGKQPIAQEFWLECQQLLLQLETYGNNFLGDTKEEAAKSAKLREDPHLDLNCARQYVERTLEHHRARQHALAQSWDAWRQREATLLQNSFQLQEITMEIAKTLDWVSRLDAQLYPILETDETNPRILVRLLEDRQSRVLPEAQRAQSEVELRLNAIETLQVQGESINQREKLIKQLVELKQRFAILIADYHLLLQMMIALFKNGIELEKTTENLLSQYSATILPSDPISVERMISEHETSKNIVVELFRFNTAQIEQIVDKIKKQEPRAAAIIDEQKIYSILGKKEEVWEQSWLQRKDNMEQHLQRCQFDADLHQLNSQLGELGAQMSRVRGQLGESLGTARANAEAFVTFEKTIELLERRVTIFISTAEKLASAENISAHHVQQELERLQTRWAGLRSQVTEVKRLIDLSVQYFILLEQAEEWFKEGSRLLVLIARRSTSVKTPEEATILLNEVDKFLKTGETKQGERIEQIKFIASQLYGEGKPKQIINVFTDSREMIESFTIVNTELITLSQKLQNDEKERQQKESDMLAAAKAEAEAERQKALAAEQARIQAEEEAARAAIRVAEEARRAAEAEAAKQALLAAEEARRVSEVDAARQAILAAENAQRRAEMESARLAAEMEAVARRAAEADAARAAEIAEEERRRKRDSDAARIALLEAQRAYEEEAKRSAAQAAQEARRMAEKEMEILVAEAAAEARKTAAAEAARSTALAMEEARKASEAEAARLVAEQQRLFAEAEAQRLALQAAEDARKAAEAEAAKLAAQAAEEARRVREAENARRAAEEARKQAELEAAIKAAEKEEALRAAAAAAAQEELLRAKQQRREEATQTLPSAFPPKFIESLNSAVVTEGKNFLFQCRVTGEPDPDIEWLKNGEPLGINPRFLISRMAEGICKLEISKALQEDGGRFTCKARNEAGKAEVEATLSVKEAVPQVTPPVFTKILQSARVKEGDTHQFECIVEGYPLPTVQWFKNGACVDSSPDYTIRFNNGHAVLIVDEVELSDNAAFICQAYNRLGNCRCEANLVVERKIPSKAPIFIMPLLASTAIVGEKYALHCEIEGSPEPIISWTKDSLPIDHTRETKILRDGDKYKCSLSISQVGPQDSGVYVISARNAAGEAVSSCNISVKEILKHEPAPAQLEIERNVLKPVIKMSLKDVEAEEGGQFKLDTIITGTPEPEVIWYHNEAPVKESKLTQLGFKGDKCTLLVKNVSEKDAGEYKVVAINPGGEVSSSCSAKIISKYEEFFPEPPKIAGFPPRFTNLLSDILVPEGEPSKLECEVEGKPTPQIQWLFNNNPITSGDGINVKWMFNDTPVSGRDFLVSTSGQRQVLTIPEVRPDLCGMYTCVAENDMGRAMSSAHLKVEEIPEEFRDLSEPAAMAESNNQQTSSFSETSHMTVQGVRKEMEMRSSIQENRSRIMQMQRVEQVHVVGNDQPVIQQQSSFSISQTPQQQIVSIPIVRERKPVAPKFISPLNGKIVDQGEDVFLEGIVDGHPAPNVTWLKNGMELPSNCNVTFKHNKVSLTIKEVSVNDAGKYTCKAENEAGYASSTADIVVKKTVFPPVFGRRLQAQMLTLGERARLEVEVAGTPDPSVTWFKDGVPVDSIPGVTIKQQGSCHFIVIEPVNTTHTGLYSVVAVNSGGQAKSSADILVVEAKPEITLEVKKMVFEDIEEEKRNSFVGPDKIDFVFPKPVDNSSISTATKSFSEQTTRQFEQQSSSYQSFESRSMQETRSASFTEQHNGTEFKRISSPAPGTRQPNLEAIAMEKLWTHGRSPSRNEFTDRPMSPRPGSAIDSLKARTEPIERSASPRPSNEALQMEKLWAHKMETKSTVINKSVVSDSVPLQPENEDSSKRPNWPPQSSFDNQQPSVPWRKENTPKKDSTPKPEPTPAVKEEIKKTEPLMKPPPQPVFQPIKPEVQHYIAETTDLVHKANFQNENVTEEVKVTKSEIASQSTQLTTTELHETNPNIITERGIKPSEARKLWAQQSHHSEPPPVPRAPKSSPAQARKVQSPASSDGNRSISPVFTVKPFDPFSQLEPFPFKPEPEGPRKERVPPPPTPSKFEKGTFVERGGSNEDFKIPPKWNPYDSDSDGRSFRSVRPPSAPPAHRAKSTGAEPLPPSQFETPSDLVPAQANFGLTLSDFSSALASNSVQQSSSSSSFASRTMTTRMEQQTRSSSTTADKEATCEQPRKREISFVKGKGTPQKLRQNSQAPTITKPAVVPTENSRVLRGRDTKSKSKEQIKTVSTSGEFKPHTIAVKPKASKCRNNIGAKNANYYFEPINKVETRHDNNKKRDVIIYSCTATTKHVHTNEPDGSMQFAKVEHSYQQQFQAEQKPFEIRVPRPKYKVPRPSKFVKGQLSERGYESDSEIVKFKPKWKPSSAEKEDPQYRKVVPRLSTPKPAIPRPASCVTPSYFDNYEPPLMEIEKNRRDFRRYSDVQQRSVFAGAREVANQQMGEMNEDFKQKAHQYMKEIKKAIYAPQPEQEPDAEPSVYREEKRQSHFGAKQIDPDTGLIYFNYDFGYEFGLILPGEKRIGIAKQGGSGGTNKQNYPLHLPDEKDAIEFPIIHERTSDLPPQEKYHTLPRGFKSRPMSCVEPAKSPIDASTATAIYAPRARSISPTRKSLGFGAAKEQIEKVFEPPVFITPLRDIAAKNGKMARVECIVQGEPTPVISWAKDGRNLGPNPNIQFFFRNGICRLQISEATPENAGKYTCTAVNNLGSARSSAKVEVF